MSRWPIALLLALSLALFGCSQDPITAEEPAPAQSTSPSPPATPSPQPGTVASIPGVEVYSAAAQQFGFALYTPTYMPAGFEYLPDESTIEPDLVGIVYGNGGARLLIIQGIWDLGDPSELISDSASFAGRPAQLRALGFAWQGPAYGQDALAVYALELEHGSNYGVVAVGVDQDELLTVARSMSPPR